MPLVCLSEPEEALAVFREKAASLGAPLFVVYPEDFRGRNLGKRIDFSYCSRYDLGDPQLQALLDTPALYQAENAALAVLAAGLLRGRDGRALLSAAQIAGGLERAHWPARMEEVADGVFIDGGHNEDGISAFLASAAGIPLEPGGRRSLLYSAVRDKRYAAMALSLTASGLFDRIILTPIAGARSLTEAELRETAEKMRSAAAQAGGAPGSPATDGTEPDKPPAQAGRIPEIGVMGPAKDAFAFLLGDKRPEDLVFAAGSLYLAGELRAYARDLLHAGYTFYRE